MPLKRNSVQEALGSLETHFKLLPEGKENAVWKKVSASMLAFIKMADQLFRKTTIWAVTTEAALILQNKNEDDAEAYIMIHNTGDNFYYFEYLMQEDKSPWPNATVKGAAKDLAEAKEYLLISMKECGAWDHNEELTGLFKQ